MQIVDAHPSFRRDLTCFTVPFIGSKAEFEALKIARAADFFHFLNGLHLVHITSPKQALKLQFTRVAVGNTLDEDQKEFLAWVRFLIDPTEGLISKARNVVVID